MESLLLTLMVLLKKQRSKQVFPSISGMTITTAIDPEQAARAFIAKVAARHDFAGAILFGNRAR
ncbi:MAG: hypothetical protein FD134_1879 [Gallionellaceae bacterium]|nr:MAG: hypothetical protein FD134_1879 [Gallionellaceae bacterium]